MRAVAWKGQEKGTGTFSAWNDWTYIIMHSSSGLRHSLGVATSGVDETVWYDIDTGLRRGLGVGTSVYGNTLWYDIDTAIPGGDPLVPPGVGEEYPEIDPMTFSGAWIDLCDGNVGFLASMMTQPEDPETTIGPEKGTGTFSATADLL